MKFRYITFIILLAGCVFVAGCKKPDFFQDDNITVQLNACDDYSEGVSLCFESLISDSRCPEGSVCFWSGDAVIRVKFHEGGNEHNFNMSLLNTVVYPYPQDTTISGYKIKFLDLKPYPGTTTPDGAASPKSFAVFSITH